MDLNLITGLSSVTIALCALSFTIWQGKQTQKHNKLSFRPHLTSWEHSNEEDKSFNIEILNNGLGPALIESLIIKIDGEEISGEGLELIQNSLEKLFPNTNHEASRSYLAKGYSMAAKEKRSLLNIKFTDPEVDAKIIGKEFKRAELIIRYKSFYDEEFMHSSKEEK